MQLSYGSFANLQTLSNLRKENGVVYTPTNLASYLSFKVLSLLLKDYSSTGHKKLSSRTLKILDPACGHGELLVESMKNLQKIVNVGGLDPSIFCGTDIDIEAILKTRINLSKSSEYNTLPTEFNNFIAVNALYPKNDMEKIDGWDSLKKKFNAQSGFDLIIANPPWGANTSFYKENLHKNFTLNKGQFDSSDLFIELALSILKPEGYFGFIIPDSIFGQERKDLRKILLEKTEIKFIGRLGEKIFEGVNRACVVLICKKATPRRSNRIECMRLNKEFREQILTNSTTYLDAEKSLSHFVNQDRFATNDNYLFDIDIRQEEVKIIKKITKGKNTIGEYLSSSRGVELSKNGKVCKCNKCEFWTPLPNTNISKCSHCKALIDLESAEIRTIISKKYFKGSKPLLVGESVRRYAAFTRHWISMANKGINYKNISLYYEPKILVRKTGVGITATIDYSNSLTNQVVYMFRPKNLYRQRISIEFILAIMNSRAMHHYLLKKYGENEWRSHPYLTQKQILDLPLPKLNTNNAIKIQTKIRELLRPYLEKNEGISTNLDARIEFFVAKLFNLNKDDYKIIYRTLNSTQGLIPVKTLVNIAIDDIFKYKQDGTSLHRIKNQNSR